MENHPNYATMANLGLVYLRNADQEWGDEVAHKDVVAKAKNAGKAILEKQSAEPDSAKP